MRTVTVANEELLPQIARLLSEGHEVTLKAKGNSMLPFIVGGRDSVVLRKPEALRCGDIVLVELASLKFVLHRIIKIEGDHITLMGDGNLQGTERCRREDVYGNTVCIIRKGKKIDNNKDCELRKARFWLKLLPIRRYLLAIYRRIII